MDFIVKLPKSRKLGSKDKFDSIFVVVDRLIKLAYFISCREVMDAEEFAFLFLDTTVRYYRILVEIILDRDKLFKSKF